MPGSPSSSRPWRMPSERSQCACAVQDADDSIAMYNKGLFGYNVPNQASGG